MKQHRVDYHAEPERRRLSNYLASGSFSAKRFRLSMADSVLRNRILFCTIVILICAAGLFFVFF